ncbi:hypothetical protein LJR164_001822 [Phenylobacterium sp. LjRoot164]|uniref:hypothetical protein n=1 Tax=unclassified Phenylobacterium TaxID=2640670 RepID=UPI003ECCFF96
MRLFAAVISALFACWASEVRAADAYVYVVNGTGGAIQVVVDAQVFPPMDHLQAVSVRAPPGKHVILAGEPKAIAAGQVQATGTSISPDLTPNSGIVDEQKRTFWCFIVGKQSDGALRVVSPNQPTCRELIRRGVGDRQLN